MKHVGCKFIIARLVVSEYLQTNTKNYRQSVIAVQASEFPKLFFSSIGSG